MLNFMDRFFAQYSTLGALAAASIVFLCGYQAYRNNKNTSASIWWIWSALILLAYGIGVAFEQQWASLVIVSVFLLADVGWIIWWHAGQEDN
jgi:membrane protein DedA with SNARE-associated domain